MGDVNFYLKKPSKLRNNNGDSDQKKKQKYLIYLQFRYSGKKLVFSFGQSIDPAFWDDQKHRVKSKAAAAKDGYHHLNDLLKKLESECLNAYHKELQNGTPTVEKIKGHLVRFINQNEGKAIDAPTLYKLIQRFIDGEIKYQGREKSEGSLSNYKSVFKHLQNFEVATRYKIDFETITLDFFYKFTHYLQKDLDLSTNTIAKDIKLLKLFMGEAVDLGYTTNIAFKNKKFRATFVETDAVHLTKAEILKLYQHDFSKFPLKEAVRDLFVFGCCVGLRYSDYSDVQPENITERNGGKYLSIKPKKTPNVVVTVPCDKVVLDIFKRYKQNPNSLPVAKKTQPFNMEIKEICRLAGLTEKGRLISDPTKELFRCISSHTARRSFATNYYLEGFPAHTIMKVTGHKSESSFLKYLKLSSIMAADKMHEHQKQHEWVLTK